MNKGDNVLKDISKTDKDKPIELPNLEPASTYSVKTSVVLPPEFGGRGDPEVTDVYTGKFKLDYSCLYWTVLCFYNYGICRLVTTSD